MEKIYKTAKWFSEKALQIAEGRREARRKEKGKGTLNQMQSSREQQGDTKRPSSMNNEKKQRKTIDWETLVISSRKLEIPV